MLPSAVPPPSLHRGAPSTRIRVADAALRRLWAAGWAEMPSLDPAVLVAKAARRAGVGPDEDRVGWRHRLALLCDDLEGPARLSSLGRTIAHGQLVGALATRFRAHALWQRHPEIAAQPIAAPVIVVGQMRSGSTRVQRLLACDPRLTYTRFYEGWHPVGAAAARLDSRRMKGRLGLACAHVLNPGFAAIHPTSLDAADEEIGLHNVSVFGAAFEAQWRVPGFTAAVEQGDAAPVYAEFRQLLQMIRWQRREPCARPWLLKVPQFAQDLPSLLGAFPDARLIHLRRDTDAVVASSASLVCNQMRLQSHHVDPSWIGAEWRRKVALRATRTAAARVRADVPQLDLGYDDMGADWLGEMRRVYRLLDLPLTPGVSAAMRAYIAASAPGRRAAHRYDPLAYGLAPTPALSPPTAVAV
ncbi:sulfotransferase [Sphingomonas yunnanensis]|uniref:sulfotransferase family protein n=1 Tax=Sphingomonas yunnanensis TaxID=310400 RepID=UPI001CA65F35|nr:sulfotransferase [Sphingomonas yunnanensis]MBY9064046.1 sulfotransferase [Sphingomonas yunnanensis]